MSAFAVKRFNWVSTPSFYQQNEVQRAKAKSATADVMSSGADAADAFASATANLGYGLAVVAAQRAAKRLNVPTTTGTSVNKSA